MVTVGIEEKHLHLGYAMNWCMPQLGLNRPHHWFASQCMLVQLSVLYFSERNASCEFNKIHCRIDEKSGVVCLFLQSLLALHIWGVSLQTNSDKCLEKKMKQGKSREEKGYNFKRSHGKSGI